MLVLPEEREEAVTPNAHDQDSGELISKKKGSLTNH